MVDAILEIYIKEVNNLCRQNETNISLVFYYIFSTYVLQSTNQGKEQQRTEFFTVIIEEYTNVFIVCFKVYCLGNNKQRGAMFLSELPFGTLHLWHYVVPSMIPSTTTVALEVENGDTFAHNDSKFKENYRKR